MRNLTAAILLVCALLTVGVAKDPGTKQKEKPQKSEVKVLKAAEKKDGTDCEPQRAGVRCRRPKPKKPWLFGS